MFTTIKSTVTAILPVKSTDKNEHWVSIWGSEISTDKKGKIDSVSLQESWRFNKDGKIKFFCSTYACVEACRQIVGAPAFLGHQQPVVSRFSRLLFLQDCYN